jgi:hypothetical protein
MKFEWDETKSLSNKKKHGINFKMATNLWNDPNRVEVNTSYPLENRRVIIGKVDDNLWTAIFTLRGETIRIISVRRARRRERELYDEKETG